MKQLHFNVSGEFITDLARSWFYDEKRPYDKVEELLLGCMGGTNTPLDVLKKYAFQIIIFMKKFEGFIGDNTFGLVNEDIERQTELKKQYPMYKYANEIINNDKIPFEICEYGFIDTKGKYIPVDWCEHSDYAHLYIKENDLWDRQMKSGHLDSTDFLVYGLGWILIDNPQQGMGIINTPLRINNKQKETLYDYYVYYHRMQEANKLYNE